MLTISLDSPSCSNLSNVGGKALNLSILSRNNDNSMNGDDGTIRIPAGFVVTTAAYHDFLHQDERSLLKEIEAALVTSNHGRGGRDHNDLEATSATIRAAFLKRGLSDALQAEIADCLSHLHPIADDELQEQYYYAVRSSATCEDMPDASFAGQHDTHLNVTPAKLRQCIVDCFSSLFTPRAISYRERYGLPHLNDNTGMAVVIQAMAPRQRSSGVLFTANPLTGRRNEMVLEAIPGLGEALVSGLTEPDRYVIARGRRDNDPEESKSNIIIKDTKIGAKARIIRSVEGGGVNEELIASDNAEDSTPVLTDEDVARVIEIGRKVEALFDGKPQDIEWAQSDDGQVYIVQSRPITTLFPLPTNVPAEPLQVYFSFNSVQGIGAPFYPAGQDALRRWIVGELLQWITWGRHGTEGGFLQTVAGRLYANITNPLRNSIGRRILCKTLPAIEPGIMAALDQLLDDPDMSINSGMTLFFALRVLAVAIVVVPRFIFSVLCPNWSRKRLVRHINDFVDGTERRIEKANDLSDLIEMEREVFKTFPPNIIPHLWPRFAAAMIPLYILTELASSVPKGNDLVLTITRGLPHNVTTEMDLKLWQVAKAIQSDRQSLDHFHSNDASTLANEYLRGDLPSTAQYAICKFMDEYGMRGLYEIDFGRTRWREEPQPLMNTLKSYVDIKEEHAPDKIFASGEAAAKDATKKLGQEIGKPWLVNFLASRIRCLAGIREMPKFTIVRMLGHLRAKMLMEGEKLVNEQVIDDAKDLFYLYDDELESLSKGRLTRCKTIIAERKAEMKAETERTRLPRVIASDGFAYYGGAATNANTKDAPNVLCGEPVSPGTYEGRIRIVHDPRETTLSQGQILCCHGTDPSWTPLFLSAGALVMEVGGLMTHGSVVAREYGIPAVVGLENVTERLSDGQLVRVDGSSGIVEILE